MRCGNTALVKSWMSINFKCFSITYSFQVCTALRKMTSVLRLGVYRERIEKYGGRVTSSPNDPPTPTTTSAPTGNGFPSSASSSVGGHPERNKDTEELLTVTLERQPGRQLGIRLSAGNVADPGIFISDIQVLITNLDKLNLIVWIGFIYLQVIF